MGKRVRQARLAAKPPVTQGDLIARLQLARIEMNQSALSKIENGMRPVTDMELAALAKALNVTSAWLLNENEKKR